MRFAKYILFSLFIFGSGKGWTQTIEVRGNVLDLENRTALEAAEIVSESENAFAVTDSNGYFKIALMKPMGTLRITVLGYKAQVVNYRNGENLQIQMTPDFYLLNEVKVSAYPGYKSNKETAGAITVLSGDAFRQGSGVSMQRALNSVPGVRLDQSTLSDSRISIRGNGVRSPWGIRDVKIYINDIPLTEADGTSRLEGIDVNDLGRAEIIRGPASSLYGAGTGGVIRFQMARSPFGEHSVEASALVGSYGLSRLATTYRNSTDKMNAYVSYGMQSYDGYREHSHDNRNFLTANFQLYPSDKRLITVLVNRTSQKSEIPGALTRSEFEDNPQQASAGNLDKRAGRDQNWTRIGLSQKYSFDRRFSNSTSVFTYFYDLDHPLPYAYLHNYYQSFGGRTQFDYDPGYRSLPVVFSLGGEFNQGNSKGTQYVNNHGVEGNISGNTDYENSLFSLFFQSDWALSSHTSLVLGLSYNGMNYDVKDYLLEERSGIKNFKPQATPRVALSHHFSDLLSLHGSVSTGFSPPSGSEIGNADGSINRELQAQKGVNFEINAKGNVLHHRLEYDLALYRMNMKDELIARTVSQGVTIYENAGRSAHNGAELALTWQWIEEKEANYITDLRTNVAVTYSDFKFVEFRIKDPMGEILNDYAGNTLPGIAPWAVNGNLSIETRDGMYGHLNYYFNDRLFLNDANSEENGSWLLWNVKVGYQKNLGQKVRMDVYGGLDNVFNTMYSSFASLNAVGFGKAPAYFNPSPGRSYFLGLRMKYFI